MKIAAYIAVLVVLAFGAGIGIRGQAGRANAGRFMLFVADHDFWNMLASGHHSHLFRMDATTGQT